MSRQNERKYLARLITEFANRESKNPQCLPKRFIELHGVPRYRFGDKEVAWVSQAFRQAWDKGQKESFAQNMEQIFADRQSEMLKAALKGVRPGSSVRKPLDPDEQKYERPAFRVVPGKRGLVFFPRDPLDRMALELLRAFSSNRLRVCGRKDKDCPTPLYVAYHAKQKYCYRGCSEQALSEWQVDLWEKRRQKRSPSKGRVTL